MMLYPCSNAVKSFIQGFLPGIALKIFLIFLPSLLMQMSKFEGFCSISALERRSATRYYIFQFVNVFLGSIITGAAFNQLNNLLHQSANEYVLYKFIFNSPMQNASFDKHSCFHLCCLSSVLSITT